MPSACLPDTTTYYSDIDSIMYFLKIQLKITVDLYGDLKDAKDCLTRVLWPGSLDDLLFDSIWTKADGRTSVCMDANMADFSDKLVIISKEP